MIRYLLSPDKKHKEVLPNLAVELGSYSGSRMH